jgi:hypothetical protein
MTMTRHENEARSSYVESGAQSFVPDASASGDALFMHGFCVCVATRPPHRHGGMMGMRQVPKARRRGHLAFRGYFRGKILPRCSQPLAETSASGWWRPTVCGWRLWSRGWRPCPFAARPLAARAAADASGDIDEARLARLLWRLSTHQFHCSSLQIHQRPCQALAARL